MQVRLFNRQRAVALDLRRLQSHAGDARHACLSHHGPGVPVLQGLGRVEISIVSDRVIAQVHRRFLGVSGGTDVITFEHGEIVISATTAKRQAQDEKESVDREVARYIVHGMLHLNGYLDQTPADATALWEVQETILQTLWPLPAAMPG